MFSNLLFTADLHLRDTTPKCRTDDFLTAQWKKFERIINLCHEHNAFWVDAGDFFHKAKPSLELITNVLWTLKGEEKEFVVTIAGNHDLPGHNMDKLDGSGLGILEATGLIRMLDYEPYKIVVDGYEVRLYGASYGCDIPIPESIHDFNILVYHGMIIDEKKNRIPGSNDPTALEFLDAHPEYDVIVSGHNHKSFTYSSEDGRVLYNVGCMTRQTADKENDVPQVILWNPDDGGRIIELPYTKGVISRAHIDKTNKKEEELNAFVESLQNMEDVSLSFEDNVKKVIKKTKPGKVVEEKVWEAVNGN